MSSNTEIEYSDNDADNLLERLVQYAEAFAGDHNDPNLTVRDLVSDLVESVDPGNQPRFERHRDRIFNGLDNKPRS
jgi:hypothetical protein